MNATHLSKREGHGVPVCLPRADYRGATSTRLDSRVTTPHPTPLHQTKKAVASRYRRSIKYAPSWEHGRRRQTTATCAPLLPSPRSYSHLPAKLDAATLPCLPLPAVFVNILPTSSPGWHRSGFNVHCASNLRSFSSRQDQTRQDKTCACTERSIEQNP